MRRVAVVGAGAWGTTVASMLAARCDTLLWAREPDVADAVSRTHTNPVFLPDHALADGLRATASLDQAIEGRDLLIMAVPAQHVRSVADRIRGLVPPDTSVISLAKGIEQHSLLRPTQVLAESLGSHRPDLIGVLSGPNLAREVMAGQPSATVVALPDEDRAAELQSLLMSDHFRAYRSTDVVGCEIGGAVKNVIAIAAGMADGLGFGWNTRAALITRGLAELTRLGVALGGEPLTFLGLAGNGDLIATCSSPQSRNRQVGTALGEGRDLHDILAGAKTVAEGVTSAPAILALAERAGIELPICSQVHAVLQGQRSPRETVGALMGREPTVELHDLTAPPARPSST